MNVTHPITTDEAIAYLTTHGFSPVPGTNWYNHRNGHARIVIEDPEAMCFTLNAFGNPRTQGLVWQAKLTCVPADVFAATISAAIS